MQQRETPIEGAQGSEAVTPTRTGDNVPTSDVTPTEGKTMTAAPIFFVLGGLVIAVIVAVILYALFAAR